MSLVSLKAHLVAFYVLFPTAETIKRRAKERMAVRELTTMTKETRAEQPNAAGAAACCVRTLYSVVFTSLAPDTLQTKLLCESRKSAKKGGRMEASYPQEYSTVLA